MKGKAPQNPSQSFMGRKTTGFQSLILSEPQKGGTHTVEVGGELQYSSEMASGSSRDLRRRLCIGCHEGESSWLVEFLGASVGHTDPPQLFLNPLEDPAKVKDAQSCNFAHCSRELTKA